MLFIYFSSQVIFQKCVSHLLLDYISVSIKHSSSRLIHDLMIGCYTFNIISYQVLKIRATYKWQFDQNKYSKVYISYDISISLERFIILICYIFCSLVTISLTNKKKLKITILLINDFFYVSNYNYIELFIITFFSFRSNLFLFRF